MRRFLLGVVITLALEALGGLFFLRLGLFPMEASARPSALEVRLATMALNASLARSVQPGMGSGEPTEADLRRGLTLYRTGCSECHGVPGQESVYGRSFYPPAPQFALQPPRRPQAEIHYVVKHGIRNTGMAAWGNTMQDEQVWKVAAFLSRLDSLPPAIEAEWRKP